MEDELLSDILAAERGIRLQIDALEQQSAERLATLRLQLDQMLETESKALQAELERVLIAAEEAALREAETLLAEAGAFAARLDNLDNVELERVVIRHLSRILPEGAYDRTDEQA